jgi:TRAP-type uncharacterized transport system fused permease subunit
MNLLETQLSITLVMYIQNCSIHSWAAIAQQKENKMNEIVLTVLKEYFEHTTGDVTLEQIETCAQAISEALETAQQSVQRTAIACAILGAFVGWIICRLVFGG